MLEVLIVIALVVLAGVIYYTRPVVAPKVAEVPDLTPIITNLVRDISTLNGLPDRMVRSLNGQISAKKGKLGELATYTKLMAEYDRLIPVGDFIDFIGLKGDSLDFIEVKTGTSRLGKSQVQTKKLIEEHKVRFLTVKHKVEAHGE